MSVTAENIEQVVVNENSQNIQLEQSSAHNEQNKDISKSTSKLEEMTIEQEELEEIEPESTLTEQGKKMAASLAEWILMNHFFPGIKDHKRQQALKSQFMFDMQFNLGTGKVIQATKQLNNKEFRNEIKSFYDEGVDAKKHCQKIEDKKTILKLIKEMRFMHQLHHFKTQEKIDFIKFFKVKRLSPGQRCYTNGDSIDSFNLIIEGKIGIFYPDLAKLKLITEPLTRIVYINEHEAEQRRLKNFHKQLALKVNSVLKLKLNGHQASFIQTTKDETLEQFNRIVHPKNSSGINHKDETHPLYNFKLAELLAVNDSRMVLRKKLTTTKEIIKPNIPIKQTNSFQKMQMAKKSRVQPIQLKTTSSISNLGFSSRSLKKSPNQKTSQELLIKDSDFEDMEHHSNKKNTQLTEVTCPIMRDINDQYNPLERLFGTLTTGHAFGESILMGGPHQNRFFNAIALTECLCLSLSKTDFDQMMNSSERKIYNDKKTFIWSIPEFKSLSLPRSKLQNFCQNLVPQLCIKNQILFSEDDLVKNVYIVRDGLFQITEKVRMPHPQAEIQNYQKFIEDPRVIQSRQEKAYNNKKTKNYVLALVTKGHIFGLQEVVANKFDFYQTKATCHSLTAEVLKIEKEVFTKALNSQFSVWKSLQNLSIIQQQKSIKQIQNMIASNFQIIDILQNQPQNDGRHQIINILEDEIEQTEKQNLHQQSIQLYELPEQIDQISTEFQSVNLSQQPDKPLISSRKTNLYHPVVSFRPVSSQSKLQVDFNSIPKHTKLLILEDQDAPLTQRLTPINKQKSDTQTTRQQTEAQTARYTQQLQLSVQQLPPFFSKNTNSSSSQLQGIYSSRRPITSKTTRQHNIINKQVILSTEKFDGVSDLFKQESEPKKNRFFSGRRPAQFYETVQNTTFHLQKTDRVVRQQASLFKRKTSKKTEIF